MRLPAARLSDVSRLFLADRSFVLLGCLGAEHRCVAVPRILTSSAACASIRLLEVLDPHDAFPSHLEATRERIEANRASLMEAGVTFTSLTMGLLVDEDQLLNVFEDAPDLRQARRLVLDISSLPKRFFAFLLKRALRFEPFDDVIVTYTQPSGYTHEHLAEDPMTCDHLPGFAAPLPPEGDTLVVAVGFEALSVRSLLEIYRDKTKDIRLILAFPADVVTVRREWSTLADMASGDATEINTDNIEVIAAWDAEAVYRTLDRWSADANGLTLAPFGPKPHTLGMTLFAMKNRFGLYYTQPKSYHPDYSSGIGSSWAYVVKWGGVVCYDRHVRVV